MSLAKPPARNALMAMVLLCLAAVGAALVSQYGFDMQPCPWCILQRVIYLKIAALALIAALVPARWPRRLFTFAALLASLAGVATALYQHFVAAKSQSCNLTLADRIVKNLGLESALPSVFHPTASCADAAVSLAGVPYEFWSLALFALLGFIAVMALRRA